MSNSAKHIIVDWIAIGFMVIGLIGIFYIDYIFTISMALGVLVMLGNERWNPYRGRTTDGGCRE